MEGGDGGFWFLDWVREWRRRRFQYIYICDTLQLFSSHVYLCLTFIHASLSHISRLRCVGWGGVVSLIFKIRKLAEHVSARVSVRSTLQSTGWAWATRTRAQIWIMARSMKLYLSNRYYMCTLDFGATTYDRHVRVQPTTKHGQLTFFLQISKCAGLNSLTY